MRKRSIAGDNRSADWGKTEFASGDHFIAVWGKPHWRGKTGDRNASSNCIAGSGERPNRSWWRKTILQAVTAFWVASKDRIAGGNSIPGQVIGKDRIAGGDRMTDGDRNAGGEEKRHWRWSRITIHWWWGKTTLQPCRW